jgi:hyaluronate lyase
MKRTILIAIVVAGILAAAAGAAAIGIVSHKISIFTKSLTHASCTVTAVTDDVYSDEFAPTTNTGAGTTTISISPRSGRRRYGWIRFDLTTCGLPANAQVDSATLTVNVTTALAGRTITLNQATSAWTESALTWNTNPTVAGAASGTFAANATGAKTVDVSTNVADWVSGAATNYGWRLADLGATSNITGAIGSSENATAGNRPTLAIAYAS